MCKKRFFKKEYSHDWWFIFDREQKYKEEMNIPFDDAENLVAMSEDQVIDLLNDLYDEIIKVKRKNHELETKNKRYVEELSICYEKLGW